MILGDSSAWVDVLAGRTAPHVDAFLRASSLGRMVVGDLVLQEVLQGIRVDRRHRETSEMMARYRQVDLVGRDIALAAAANYRLLRKRGITVRGTIDVIIATWCIEHDVPIIHNDRDMSVMERELGLRAYA